ncbi:hypothetical protein F5Y03DRAFT_403193 [Xylaria venustula]|nr:hypothetical protein F5Y03DRAFT_403193 [Xylaria venustula]
MDDIAGYQDACPGETAYYEERVHSVEEDPLESWYTNVGYLPRLDETTLDVLEQVLSPDIMSSIKVELYKTVGDRTLGLNDRNVRIFSCLPRDPFLAMFDGLKPLRESGSGVHLPGLHDEVKKYLVDEWRLDRKKATEDRLEAIFQRTVIMSMLDRYRLIYSPKDGNQPVLDFAVESTWNCPFMPTRALKKIQPDPRRLLSRPKPDISDYALRGTQRAFHFLMVEAKNVGETSIDTDDQLENLNSASQSLHCLYEFFNEADRQEVECDQPCCTSGANITTTVNRKAFSVGEDTFVGRFFETVRVFTAVSTGNAITIQVHRACPASTPPFPGHGGRPPFQTLILPDYPLQFEYNELIRIKDDDFAREKLVNTFEKIMVDYGIGRLRPLLQDAAQTIAKKFYKWETENGIQYELGMRHYSHGQTGPLPTSAQTSRGLSSVSITPVTVTPQASSASAGSPTPNFSFSAPTPNKRIRRC